MAASQGAASLPPEASSARPRATPSQGRAGPTAAAPLRGWPTLGPTLPSPGPARPGPPRRASKPPAAVVSAPPGASRAAPPRPILRRGSCWSRGSCGGGPRPPGVVAIRPSPRPPTGRRACLLPIPGGPPGAGVVARAACPCPSSPCPRARGCRAAADGPAHGPPIHRAAPSPRTAATAEIRRAAAPMMGLERGLFPLGPGGRDPSSARL